MRRPYGQDLLTLEGWEHVTTLTLEDNTERADGRVRYVQVMRAYGLVPALYVEDSHGGDVLVTMTPAQASELMEALRWTLERNT